MESGLTRAIRISLDQFNSYLGFRDIKTGIGGFIAIANKPVSEFAGTVGVLVEDEFCSGADEALQRKRGQDES